MKVLHPLAIAHAQKLGILIASVVIADGRKAEIVQCCGDDLLADEAEAHRLTGRIINVLLGLEVEIPDAVQQEWFKASADKANWVTT